MWPEIWRERRANSNPLTQGAGRQVEAEDQCAPSRRKLVLIHQLTDMTVRDYTVSQKRPNFETV